MWKEKFISSKHINKVFLRRTLKGVIGKNKFLHKNAKTRKISGVVHKEYKFFYFFFRGTRSFINHKTKSVSSKMIVWFPTKMSNKRNQMRNGNFKLRIDEEKIFHKTDVFRFTDGLPGVSVNHLIDGKRKNLIAIHENPVNNKKRQIWKEIAN